MGGFWFILVAVAGGVFVASVLNAIVNLWGRK
jgi:hypothetical protein